jgi:hypothetical protein
MLKRRTLLSSLLIVGLIVGGGAAIAKNEHHHDGHAALGPKLHENGRHEISKIGTTSVTAEVKDNKVVNMSAGNLPVKKVKSKKKMASLPAGIILASDARYPQVAQMDTYYYGYCFDTGTDIECYWYPASDVVVTDGWVDYAPM